MYKDIQYFNIFYVISGAIGAGVLSIVFGIMISAATGWPTLIIAGPIFSVLLGLHLLNFYSLTKYVDDSFIIVKFGIGMVKRKISIDQITSCEPIKNSFRGIIKFILTQAEGISIYPSLSMWPLQKEKVLALPWRFREFISITMKDGKKYLIGTNQAEKFSSYINEKNRTAI